MTTTHPARIAVADLNDDVELHHAANCAGPKPRIVPGRRGLLMLRCRNCPTRLRIHEDQLKDPEKFTLPSAPAPAPRWRARR